jgi:hypothetical protein
MIAAGLERVKATPNGGFVNIRVVAMGLACSKQGKGRLWSDKGRFLSRGLLLRIAHICGACGLHVTLMIGKKHSKLQPSPIRLRRLTADLYYHCVSIASRKNRSSL